MKLETLLTAAWLASSASAVGPATPKDSRLDGKPEKMAGWRWTNPFTAPSAKKFTPSCTASRTFAAREFVLDDLAEDPPLGLLPYRDALKQVFSTRQYPGSWDGIDPHGYDRLLLTMEYSDVPLNVREWIEEQERSDGEGKGLFAVYGKPGAGTRVLNIINVPRETPVNEEWRARDENRVVVFAPGALYEVAPLFVAAGSECEGELAFCFWFCVCFVFWAVLTGGVCRSAAGPRQLQRGARQRRCRCVPRLPHQAQPVRGQARNQD